MKRFIRKHLFVFGLGAILLGVVFLPALAGRIISPNDVYHHYDPWASIDAGRAQNPLVHDPPLSYYSLVAMFNRGGYFHWNPFIGGGIPGVGSVASAILSPFVLIPALVLPLALLYSGMVVGKLLVPLWFGYLWLREERLGKRGAGVGATVLAAAGPYAVWWLWQGSNATALYPVLLWACARLVRGKHNSFGWLVFLALAFLLSGFPATIAYGAYLAIIYVAWGFWRFRRFPGAEVRKALLAAVVAVLVASPLLDPFVTFLGRTGYLEARADASRDIFLPWSHLRSFVQPFWLGDPVTRSWIGDSALGPMNNFVEATVYLGFITLLLLPFGLFRKRAPGRWLFAGLFLLLIGMMFGSGLLSTPFAGLPGLKYSPMVRLRVALPVPAAFLAGAGWAVVSSWVGRRRDLRSLWARVPQFAAVAIAADLALFAAWFTPHIPWSEATPPVSETVTFLQEQEGPFRIAPTFPYLMPNSAQLVGLEDVRAHWGAERDWRDLLRRLDPGSVDVTTVSTFNSLRMRLDDPLLSLMNVRYVIEPPKIGIIRYLIQDQTEWIVDNVSRKAFGSGERLEIAVDVKDLPFNAVAVPFGFEGTAGADPYLDVSVLDTEGRKQWSRRIRGDELAMTPVIHAPLLDVAIGDRVTVILESNGAWGTLGADAADRVSYGRVKHPFILARTFRDGRVFENLENLPRFRATWESRSETREEFLEDRTIEPERVAVFEGVVPLAVGELSMTPMADRRVTFEVGPLEDGVRSIRVSAERSFLLTSSEKVSPELRVMIDGESTRVFSVDSTFAAVLVGAGDHEVVFERRIGRGWWPWCGAGLFVWGLGLVRDRRHPVGR